MIYFQHVKQDLPTEYFAFDENTLDEIRQYIQPEWEQITSLPPPPIPPLTVSDVITERERRLAAGFDYDFADARGVHRIGTTDADMSGWDEVSKAASALVALGLPDQALSIVTDTGPCDVTAIEWQSVLVGAMQFRQPIFAASFALQASDPIPQDYTDDVNWQ
jgi:hypothetical protein